MLATHTQRHIRERVHAVLQDALSLEIVPRNVAEGQEVKAPPIEAVGIALEPEQQAALLYEAYKERHYFTLYLALATGLRQGELLALRRERDVDLKKGVIHVRETRGSTIHSPKTKTAVRTVPLSPSGVKAIEDWYSRLERERGRAKEAYQDSGFLLVDELGNPVYRYPTANPRPGCGPPAGRRTAQQKALPGQEKTQDQEA
ncbi:MAG: tyrosine-type recombinase/integrase [Thermaceae bacterium]|nr:tyrosine-type recombinase/integrase [Thermaceae bacterium]